MKLQQRAYSTQTFGILLSVSVALFVIAIPFSVPNKLVVSLILGILFYALFEYCLFPDLRLTIRTRPFIGRLLRFRNIYVLAYASSLLIAILPIDATTQLSYVPWGSLGFFGFARLLASVLLTSFLPGYAIIQVIAWKSGKTRLANVGTGVLSVLLSLMVTSMVTDIHWIVEQGFMQLSYTLWLSYLLFFAFFIIGLFVKQDKPNDIKEHNTMSLHSFYKFLIFLLICAFLMWSFFSTHLIPQTMNILDDEFGHAGLSQQLSRGWQPWQSAETGINFGYPYFFHLTLIATASLSNAPFINVYLSFFFLLMLPVFAFYFMLQMVLRKEKEIPVIATTVFSVFSGFGWIYAVLAQIYSTTLGSGIITESQIIGEASERTYDIIYSTWLPIYIAPYIVDLSVFLVLIGLMRYKHISTRSRGILVILLVVLGTSVHIEKMAILAALLFILSLLYVLNVKLILNPKTVITSFISGLSIVLFLDLLSPYEMTPAYSMMILYSILIDAAGLILMLAVERLRITVDSLALGITLKQLRNAFPYIALSSYFILSIAFSYSSPTYAFNSGSVPLWFLPVKTGIAGILWLSAVFSRGRGRRRIDFFVIMCITTIFIEIILYHLPLGLLSVNYAEFRVFRDILWPFLSIVAAYGMSRLTRISKVVLSHRKSVPKYFAVFSLLLIVCAGGIPSHLLKVEYFASRQRIISSEEMDALNYMSTLNIPSGSFILTVAPKDELYALTGVRTYSLSDPVFAPLIFQSRSSGTGLWILNYLNISYIYLNSQDLQLLHTKFSDSFLTWLIPHFPILFNNSAASIYAVPAFSPSVDNSNVAVVSGDLIPYVLTPNTNVIWIDDNFTEGWKQLVANNVEQWNFTTNGDIATLEAKTVPGQQAAVFYIDKFSTPVPKSEGMMVFLKFRSNTLASYLVLDILYSDDSTQRLAIGSMEYLRSSTWTTVVGSLNSNMSVTAVRVGLTDNREANGGTISVSLDYVAIAIAPPFTNYYLTSLLPALMQVNYVTISEFDTPLFDYSTIFIPDINLNNSVVSRYVDWVKKGGNLIVVGSDNNGTFSDLLGVKESGNSVLVDGLVSNKGAYTKIPAISIPEKVSNGSAVVIANYTLGTITKSPFAVLKDLEVGRIVYIEVGSLIESLKGSPDLIRTLDWTLSLLQDYANLSRFNSVSQDRGFYVKNIGAICLQGEIAANTSNIIGDLGLTGVTLDFWNSSQSGDPTFSLENVTVSNIESSLILPTELDNHGELILSSIDSSSYVKLNLNGEASFNFYISSENRVNLTLGNGNSTNLLFRGGMLVLRAPSLVNTEVIVRDPMVTADGGTIFDSLYASYPYAVQSVGNRVEFDGHIVFRVRISGGDVLLLDDILLNGNLRLYGVTASAFGEDLDFLTSCPQGFLLSVFVIVLLMIPIRVIRRRLVEVSG